MAIQSVAREDVTSYEGQANRPSATGGDAAEWLRAVEQQHANVVNDGNDGGPTNAIPPRFNDQPTKRATIEKNIGRLTDPKGDFAQKLSAIAALAKDLQPNELKDLLAKCGVNDAALAKLVTDKDALGAVAKLTDPKSNALDRISAALTLTKSIGALAPDKYADALKQFLAAVPAGAKLADAISKFIDPKAKPFDKVKASFALAQALRDSAGKEFPRIASNLLATDSFFKCVNDALTLQDPNASLQDKAKAALNLAATVPDLAGDTRKIAGFLKQIGVSSADAIGRQAANMAAQSLPKAVADSLAPQVRSKLTPAQIDELGKLASDDKLKDVLPAALKKLKDPEALDSLLASLRRAGDKDAQKAVLDFVSKSGEGVADKLLTSTIDGKPASEVLADLVRNLSPEARDSLAKIAKSFDADALCTLLRLGSKVDVKLADEMLPKLASLDGKVASDAMKLVGKMLDSVISKFGVKMSAEVATKVLDGVVKAIPLAGAAPAVCDAVHLAQVAANDRLPPEIRFLALAGCQLNGTDAALAIAQPFIDEFAVPVAAAVAMSVAETGIDLVVADQEAKFNADPKGYRAPQWLTAVDVGAAAAMGPEGVTEMFGMFGPEGAENAFATATQLGGKAAEDAGTDITIADAKGLRSAEHFTAQDLHRLADMIRHPERFGQAAVQLGREAAQKLSELARGTDALAKVAAKQLDGLVTDLEREGHQGMRALVWIASHPGAAASRAVSALTDIAEQGLRQGSEAGRVMAKAAMDALGEAKGALAAAGADAREALRAADRATQRVAAAAIALGQKGLDALAWMAQHPGQSAEMAKQVLVNLASTGGMLAKEAYDKLVGLGHDGIELTKQVARNLAADGKNAVDMLGYVVEHPGAAGADLRRIALNGLKDIAKGVGDEAQAATHALLGFVSDGIKDAEQTVRSLWAEGSADTKRIVAAWAQDFGPGLNEVLGGLGDVGSAAISDGKRVVGWVDHLFG
jgi:hypothetical protein